ncbi:MAG: succinate--CoA ligase subunit alpha [Bacteroidetes bacterium]|nr:succinate--CoA ligase subunit alpha [Bacteroidota bacterium]
MAILVDENTRVLVQGITGREATTFTMSMLEYGTPVLAGVTPGKGGQNVYGVPVYNTVKEAMAAHPEINTSIVSVPPAFTKDAVMEAVDGGINFISVFTERIPRGDVCQMLEYAKNRGARIVGPNSLGMCSPGRGKLGAIGGPAEEFKKAYIPGPVAILSRSGGMLTETASLLTQNGIGMSTAINIGGDPIIGSTFVELLPLLEQDPDTKVIVLFCEPGTSSEERLSEWVKEVNYSKPIVAFVTGRFVDDMQGMRFGHAAVIVEGNTGSARGKMKAMRDAGIVVVETHDQIAIAVKKLLAEVG